jgi:hypothetical protein
MAKKVSDVQVAEFLAEFRDRKPEEQEASPVWQELVSFPQWGIAKFVPDKVRPAPEPAGSDASLPDPRLSASARADITKARAEQRPPVAAATKVSGNTIKTDGGAVNPWADYKCPSLTGALSIALRTNVPPPASFGDPSKWRQTQDGWSRSE